MDCMWLKKEQWTMKMVQLKQQRQHQVTWSWKKMEAEHSEWGKLATALEKEFVPKYDTRFHQQDRTQWWEWWWKKEKTEIWRAQSNNNLHFVFSLHLMLRCPQAELLGKNTAYSRNQDTTINSHNFPKNSHSTLNNHQSAPKKKVSNISDVLKKITLVNHNYS